MVDLHFLKRKYYWSMTLTLSPSHLKFLPEASLNIPKLGDVVIEKFFLLMNRSKIRSTLIRSTFLHLDNNYETVHCGDKRIYNLETPFRVESLFLYIAVM